MFKSDRLVHLLSLLPLVTAGLYFFGITFHQGYMRVLGLEESLFPLTVDRSLFQGFIALLTMGIPGAIYALLAAEFIYFGAEAFVFVASLTWKTSLEERSDKASKVITSGQEEHQQKWGFREVAERMFIIFVSIFGVLLLIFLAGYFADLSGQRTAQQFMTNVANSNVKMDQIWMRDKTEPLIGALVTCSTAHCAYRTKDASIVIGISDIRTIQHQSASAR